MPTPKPMFMPIDGGEETRKKQASAPLAVPVPLLLHSIYVVCRWLCRTICRHPVSTKSRIEAPVLLVHASASVHHVLLVYHVWSMWQPLLQSGYGPLSSRGSLPQHTMSECE